MVRRRGSAIAVALLGAALVASACNGGGGGGTDRGERGEPTAAKTKAEAMKSCPVDALDDGQPVTITMWHVQSRKNLEILQGQIARFQAANPNIKVDLVQIPNYDDLLAKWMQGGTTGDRPDLAQMEETTVQKLVDSETTTPMADCVLASDTELDDFLPRAIDYYTTQDTLRAMPWLVSNPILIYDRNDFVAAGLDPDDPPQTLAEVREVAEKIQASGATDYGISLHTYPYLFEFLYAKSGAVYVNNDNGREERATKAQLDQDEGLEIWEWWNELVTSGVGLDTGAIDNDIDHLLALGNGQSAMSIEASGALGPIFEFLEQNPDIDIDPAAAPLPSIDGGGGVPVGDASLWINAESSDAEKAAAWKLTQFLTDTEQIVEFAVESGYVPIRESAVDSPAVQEVWAAKPWLKAPYEQLTTGGDSAATLGSVIGPYKEVRDAVKRNAVAMLTEGKAPKDALRAAQQEADAAIEEYNQSIGVE